MNILLIFFALPIAVIIISIALQKILKNPILVAAIIFAIFLIVTFIVNNLNFLIAAIVYAILSFITAFITCVVGRLLNRLVDGNSCSCRRENSCSCGKNNDDERSYQITSPDGTTTRVNIVSNSNNTCGCCRRR